LTLAIILWPLGAKAQWAPTNATGIAGRTFELTVGWSLPGSGLAPANSKFRFLPSEVDNTYDVVPLSTAGSPSTGTFSYLNTGANTATLTQTDILLGTGSVYCTFTNATSGTYRTVSSGIEVQRGTFTMSAAAAPASIAGGMFTVNVTSGSYPFSSVGSTVRIRPDAAGNYKVEAVSGDALSTQGTYSYTKNLNYTASLAFNDSFAGNGVTSKFFFSTAMPPGTVTLLNAARTGYQTGTFTFTPNSIPTINPFTSLANATTNEDTPTGAIGFTVSDGQTLAADLTVSATSNVPSLVSSFNFGGGGGSRTLSVVPAQNQSGTATITVTVADGGGMTALRTFTLTVNAVNDPPTISGIAAQSTAAGVPTAAIPFTIADIDTPLTSLSIAKTSSNITVVPLNNIVLGGSGADRTVTVTPAAGQTGSSTITLTVNGGGTPAPTTSFTVAVNAPPTITIIPNTTTNEDTDTVIPFTVTPAGPLSVAGSSSNTSLVPHANLRFGGTGASRTLTVSPATNAHGSTTISVTVTDGGGLTASDSFVLTVHPVNDPPVISFIENQTTSVGVPTAAIPFTISDVDSPPASFTITNRTSSNTSLVPVAGIAIGGSGASRTVTVTPAAGQTGFADITLTVGDGHATASITFRVTVAVPFLIGKGATWKYLAPLAAANAPPANWTGIGFSDTAWGSGTAPIGYGGDGEVTAIPTASGKPFTFYLRRKFSVTGAAGTLGLRLNLRRDDGAVVYLNGIEKWRSNMPEGVSISYDTPARGVTFLEHETTWFTREVRATGLVEGDNVVAVEIHQYDAASSDLGFDLEVIPLNYAPNSPPWISDIPDRVLAPGAGSGAVGFSVGDGESTASALSVTATSSNPAVIPAGNIVFGGSGANRTITVTAPVAAQAGSALITVTVSDGVGRAATAFVVTVTPATSSVKLAAWGYNDRGQLGNNSNAPSANPVAISFSGALAAKTPVEVATGEAHSVVLFSDGTLAAWGRNDEGQLGTGNFSSSLVPVPVPATGALAGKTVLSIDAGRYHTIALCSDGTVACWGGGGYGELGNNGSGNSSIPVQVLNSGVLAGKVVTHVAAGSNHNLALCSDGTIAAWGMNYDGALGINAIDCCRSAPVAVQRTGTLLNKTVVAISAGYHSLALCSDGTLAAWGDNQYGQLGNNSANDSPVPVEVSRAGVLSTRTPTSIAAGSYHSLAACSDGRVAA